MAGEALEVHRDDTPFAFGTHKGANGANNLYVKGADFKSCGVQTGVLIKNITSGASGIISEVSEDTIVATMTGGIIGAGVELTRIIGDEDEKFLTGEDDEILTDESEAGTYNYWNNGDSYEIYLTDTEDSLISSIWTDRRFGMRTKEKLFRGLRQEDTDLDEYTKNVFGPGQPGIA